jgi:hypothetical protein
MKMNNVMDKPSENRCVNMLNRKIAPAITRGAKMM